MRRSLLQLVALGALGVLGVGACGRPAAEDVRVLGERVSQEAPVVPAVEPAANPAVEIEPTVTTVPASTTSSTTAPVPLPGPPDTAAPTPPRDAAPAVAGVHVSLSLDTPTSPAGEVVRGTLSAENRTDDAVDVTHPGACPTGSGLYRDGSRASEARSCAATRTPDALAPGETRTWAIEIRTGGVAPGVYDAYAGVRVTGGTWYAPAVTVTVA